MLALYQSMNHQVTTYTDRVIDKTTRFLPLSCRHFVKEKYQTESRIMTLWLGGAAIAQGAIIGSIYGSSTVAYSLGGVLGLPIVSSLASHIKHYVSLCASELDTVGKVAALSYNTFLWVLGAMASAEICSYVSPPLHSSIYLWSSPILALASTFFPAVLLSEVRKEKDDKKKETRRLVKLREEVDQYTSDIKRFDTFVESHPKLFQECLAAYRADPDSVTKPSQSPLDPYDPHLQDKDLSLALIKLEFAIQRRIYFFQSHPNLMKSFCEHFRKYYQQQEISRPYYLTE